MTCRIIVKKYKWNFYKSKFVLCLRNDNIKRTPGGIDSDLCPNP